MIALRIVIFIMAVIGPVGCLITKVIRANHTKNDYTAWMGVILSALLCYSYFNIWAVVFYYPNWVLPHHDPDTYCLFRMFICASAFISSLTETLRKSSLAGWFANGFLLYAVIDIYSSVFIFDNYRGP
jgi:hypothetical protein